MSHLFERVAGGDGFLWVDVESSNLCFRGGRQDCFNNLGDGEDGTIVGGYG